jgi:hypothetical protein
MRLVRVVVALLAILGLSTAGFAGDLRESLAKAAQQEANTQSARIDKRYAWPGAALFAGGMALALYGFLHTSGGQFVSGEVSKESHTGLGAAGLAVAAAGGTILYVGAERARHAPSIAVGPGRVTVAKRLSW